MQQQVNIALLLSAASRAPTPGREGEAAAVVHALNLFPVPAEGLVRQGRSQLHHVPHAELPAQVTYGLMVHPRPQVFLHGNAVGAPPWAVGANAVHKIHHH